MLQIYQLRWYVSGVVILLFGGIVFYNISFDTKINHRAPVSSLVEELLTINPEAFQPEHTIFGTVIQHGYATVHPRREGIISDIYVDIGEKVRAGQPLASFFPPGVEGFSSSSIQQKTTRVSQARIRLQTAQDVANETLKIAKRDVVDKESAFAAVNNLSAKYSRNQTSEKNVNRIRVAEEVLSKDRVALQTASQKLEAARGDSDQKILEIAEILRQAEIQSVSIANEVTESVVNVFFDNTQRDFTKQNFNFNDLSTNYGALDNASRREIEKLLKDGLVEKEQTPQEALIESLMIVYSAEKFIKNTTSGSGVSVNALNAKQEKIISLRGKVLAAQEKLVKAQELEKTKVSSEHETIVQFEQLLIEKQAQVKSSERKLDLVKTELGESVENAKEYLQIQNVSQSKEISQAKIALDVAIADLQKEQVSAGHTQLLAPFTGTIAVRNMNLGDRVTSANTVFEMIGTKNSLTRKSAVQIHFTLPESLFYSINIGDEVKVRSVYGNKTFRAKVDQVSQQIHSQTQGYMVQLTPLEEMSLQHGSSVKITFTDESSRYYRVPSMVVKRDNSRAFIFILQEPDEMSDLIKDPIVKKVFVEIQAIEGEFAQIMGNLTLETQIVTSFPDTIINFIHND